jgi:P-type Cu2+ transporter
MSAVLETLPQSAGGKPVKACRHCGAPLAEGHSVATGFCCAGCAYVHRLVHEHNLGGYYRLKDSVTPPADSAIFQPRDYGWLEDARRDAEGRAAPSGAQPELVLDLQGISCAGCVWLIERLFQQQPGGRDCNVNAQYGTMRLRWKAGEFSPVAFARKLQSFGYLVGPNDPERADPESRDLVRRVGLCAAFALNVMLFTLPVYFGMEKTFPYARLFGLLSLGFATLSFLVGGSYFLGRAWHAARLGLMHLDLPIAIGIAGAYLGSLYGWVAGLDRFIYFDFVATFILLMLVGRWAQTAAVERNRSRLLRNQPGAQKVRLADGTEVPREKLGAGAEFLIAPAQTVPVEARMREGEALFSLASINGETEPRVFRAGQRVPSGALNIGRGGAALDALESWDESLLARLLKPGERAGRRHRLLERIVRGYLLGILVAAAAAGAFWWLRTGDAPKTWSVVIAVLVVSCPCAIGLAFPLADEIATTALRRRGIFVRENDLWASLGRVRKVVFDKTGTLTFENPTLLNPEELLSLDGRARSALFALVRESAHPVSQCLLANLVVLGAVEPVAGEVRETPGFGIEIGPWSLGRAGWRGASDRSARGSTEFAFEGRTVARFFLSDEARPDAHGEVAALLRAGYQVQILSGDDRGRVQRMAGELGLPASCAIGALSPDAKARWIEEHGADDALMIGDGANDSLAFDRALCRGTPVIHRGVLERKSDFYYLGRGIGGIRALLEVNAVRHRTQLVILAFSAVYNLAAVGFAVSGRINPLLAAVLMPANSLAALALVSLGMRRAWGSGAAGLRPVK